MKYAILIGDGMADEPQAELDGKTPLEHASTPNMDALAVEGKVRLVQTVPEGMPPGSDVANMSLLGYDPARYYTGRAPIEAAGMGIDLPEGSIAFRCNLVHIEDGRMADYSAGAISTEDAGELVEELRLELESDTVSLHAGVSYRHLLVIRGLPRGSIACTPPHDISGKDVEAYLPEGEGGEVLRRLMERAHQVLSASSVNQRLQGEGKVTVTDVWFWGGGAATVLPTIHERFGLTGSVISAVDLVRGLGRLAGLQVVLVEGATGYLDTNYAGKTGAAGRALESGDLVYLHVEAPDEVSHEGSLSKKLQAIEAFDEKVVGEIRRLREHLGDLRILVLPDHATLLSTRTHGSMPVPYVVSGPGVSPDGRSVYSEGAASPVPLLSGCALFQELLEGSFA